MGSLEDNFVYALLGTSDFMLYPYITKYAFHVLVIFHTSILYLLFMADTSGCVFHVETVSFSIAIKMRP